MRYHAHFGELPLEGFKHCGDNKIKPQGGGGVPIISDVVDFAGDVVGDVGGFIGDTVGSVGDTVGAFIDDPFEFAGNVVEGALDNPLKTAAMAAATYFGLPALSQALGTSGLGASALADAGFIGADAAGLAAQGLSEAQIASTLAASGVDAFAAADAARLAASGLAESAIAQNLGSAYTSAELFTPQALESALSLKNIKQGVDVAKNLSALTQTGTPAKGAAPLGMLMAGGGQQRGAGVDYSPTLSLLEAQKASTPNVYSLLG